MPRERRNFSLDRLSESELATWIRCVARIELAQALHELDEENFPMTRRATPADAAPGPPAFQAFL